MPSLETQETTKSTQTYVDTATAHANPKWHKAALAAVKTVAEKQETLISADVLTEIADSDVKTHDLRALGGIMIEARDLGLIESSGLVRRSDKHTRGATTLWKSLLYRHPNQSETSN
jgi:hypothetical protein